MPGRDEFSGLITNLERELQRTDVSVHKNQFITAATLLVHRPDAVIIATGALPYRPPGEFDEAHVVTAWDVIENRANVGKSVVIADWRCDWVGMELAEKLATEGCHVKLCVNGEMAGQNIQSYVRQGRLHRLGVEVIPYLRLFGANADTVYMQHVMTEEAVVHENTDTLVLAYGHKSQLSLYDELVGEFEELHAIGDCLSPRTAEEAILEGLKVASAI